MTDITDGTTIDEAPARRLVRVRDGRWLGGVAAGLGRYFDVNPLVYRIAFAALAFAGGTGILIYLAAWLVIPAEDREESAAVTALREHRDRPWLLLGVGLLLFAAVLVLSEADLWTGVGNVWLAAVLAGSALLWWHLAHRDERPASASVDPPAAAPRAPKRPSLTAPVVGALLAAAGVFGLLAVVDVYTLDLDIALAAAVAAVGVSVAVGAFAGYRVAALVPLGLVLLAGFGIAAATPASISEGVGDERVRPLDAAALERTYEYGMGDYELDLTGVELPQGETRVEVSLGIGDLLITVPSGATVEVGAHAGIGDVILFGAGEDGIGADRSATVLGDGPDAPRLVLDADVGLGKVEVRRG
jgi:phage shock protein PspC (stress-responsive transcriptional regulator)